jgi:hypothetical protein
MRLVIAFECLRCCAPVRVTVDARPPQPPDPTEPVEWHVYDDEHVIKCGSCAFPHTAQFVNAHHAIDARVQQDASELLACGFA